LNLYQNFAVFKFLIKQPQVVMESVKVERNQAALMAFFGEDYPPQNRLMREETPEFKYSIEDGLDYEANVVVDDGGEIHFEGEIEGDISSSSYERGNISFSADYDTSYAPEPSNLDPSDARVEDITVDGPALEEAPESDDMWRALDKSKEVFNSG
jgi:hypothetical protein